MSKIPPTAAKPAYRLDPDLSVMENARKALEQHQAAFRVTAEREALTLAAKVFRGSEFTVDFRDAIAGGDMPLIVVEDELIGYNPRSKQLVLVELCGECGANPRGHEFKDLVGLGVGLTQRDDRPAHVCDECTANAALVQEVS